MINISSIFVPLKKNTTYVILKKFYESCKSLFLELRCLHPLIFAHVHLYSRQICDRIDSWYKGIFTIDGLLNIEFVSDLTFFISHMFFIVFLHFISFQHRLDGSISSFWQYTNTYVAIYNEIVDLFLQGNIFFIFWLECFNKLLVVISHMDTNEKLVLDEHP